MKRVAYYQWIVRSETAPFKMVKTRHMMDEETALRRHPEAIKVESSMEVRSIPETPEERMANTTSAWQKPRR